MIPVEQKLWFLIFENLQVRGFTQHVSYFMETKLEMKTRIFIEMLNLLLSQSSMTLKSLAYLIQVNKNKLHNDI